MFHWKNPEDIWKGEGVYHLTFVLKNRRPILADLILDKQNPRCVYTQLGLAVFHSFEITKHMYPAVRFLADRIMPDHLHVVLWVTQDIGRSIKELALGMRQGWKKLSPELVFDPPYIRTLSHKGQLRDMCQYVSDNPRRAVIKRLNPDMFKIRRNLQVTRNAHTFTFSALGNPFLIDYPQRQVVICSRSMSDDRIQEQLRHQMFAAQMGAVTYSAAISDGERTIVRAIREAGYPLVVLLRDGFPREGDPKEKFFKPEGVYFDLCAEGRLLLIEPRPEDFEDPFIVELTDKAILASATARHIDTSPLRHFVTRWQMMAANQLLKVLTGCC